jgi:hypothetical protein
LTIGNKTVEFRALTIIDLVTNLVELVRINSKKSRDVTFAFVNTWLARYPKPVSCIYDQGTEFTGYEFQDMLERTDIEKRMTTAKNPQSNAICERMHQSVGNSLRTLRNWHPPLENLISARQLVDNALANAMYATCASYSGSLKTTPGALAFHRDMVMNIPLLADLTLIQENRQQMIDQRLIQSNRKRFAYNYQPGQRVLKMTYRPDKLEPRAEGPFTITAVHTNGTVTIQYDQFQTERLSIRVIKPYHQ